MEFGVYGSPLFPVLNHECLGCIRSGFRRRLQRRWPTYPLRQPIHKEQVGALFCQSQGCACLVRFSLSLQLCHLVRLGLGDGMSRSGQEGAGPKEEIAAARGVERTSSEGKESHK